MYLRLFIISETSSAILESPALEHTEFMCGLVMRKKIDKCMNNEHMYVHSI